MTFPQLRKESILSCLLMKGQHFLYRRGARKVRAAVKRVKICWCQELQEVGM